MTPAATSPAAPAAVPWWRALATLNPKHLITILITLILVVGELTHHILGGYDRLVVALGACLLTEILLSLFLLGRFPLVQSAYISGISLSLLLKPQGDLLWPFALGAALSIGSKYALRYRGNHLWNPTNLGVALLLLVAAPKLAILSHEWGNSIGTNAVIWSVGLLVATRARILHVTLTYALAFCVLAWLRTVIDINGQGVSLGAEIGPITGPMYQLFVFFMITDPRTTVSTKAGRVTVALLIALVECGLRLGADVHMAWAVPFSSAPAIFALFLVGPIAKAWDLRRKALASAAPAR